MGGGSDAVIQTLGLSGGSFTPAPNGTATYRIPIVVPPGTAGLQPSLGLVYNSQGPTGLLGAGWGLDGLPAITRCGATFAQDGFSGGVKFDANDRFCLAGHRLMVINGAYGAHGAEYRTEVDSFVRVVSYGAAGTGPASFRVWTKAGQVMELGGTADSRIEAEGRTSVLVWAVNKIQDASGNYLVVSYAEDNANGEYRPVRIDYTGNAAGGLAPTRSITFEYDARPDQPRKYVGGPLMRWT